MAQLKITKVDGTVSTHEITPSIEYAFESYKGAGFHKVFREQERQSDVYWLAYECLKKTGVTLPLFGSEFLDTLKKVEVLDSDPFE